MKHDWQSVPMPSGIAALDRDPRGFPITFTTLIQSDGRPDFTTIDGRKILRCIQEGLCGMCGREIEGHFMAFIGGPGSCETGGFLDPPMHLECAHYASQVCPHLVIPTSRYSKPKEGEGREVADFVDPNRPDRFGIYATDGYRHMLHLGHPVFVANPAVEVKWL